MIYIVLNWLPILTATLAALIFGALYYSSGRRGRGGSLNPAALLPIAFVAEFWLASILAGALILAPSKADVWTMTLGSAFVIWLGFVVPVIATTYRLRGLGVRTTLIDCGHWLGVMLIEAAVLRVIGLVPPPVA